MIYVTEGLQIDGKIVRFLTLSQLLNIFENCPAQGPYCPKLIIKNIALGKSKVLKALPIHIEKSDVPLLNRMKELQCVLTRDVVFKVNTSLSESEHQILKQTGCTVEMPQTEEKNIIAPQNQPQKKVEEQPKEPNQCSASKPQDKKTNLEGPKNPTIISYSSAPHCKKNNQKTCNNNSLSSFEIFWIVFSCIFFVILIALIFTLFFWNKKKKLPPNSQSPEPVVGVPVYPTQETALKA